MNTPRVLFLSLLGALSAGGLAQRPLNMAPPDEARSAILIGDMDPSAPIHLSVNLNWGDAAGIQRFVDSVSNPKSPNYRHFITPDEVGRRFGLPIAAVQRVADYLTAKGLHVSLITKNRLGILADGTVGQAEAAFHTGIATYLSSSSPLSSGPVQYSFTSTPSVPASVAPYIVHVGGLENFYQPAPQAQFISPSQLETLYGAATEYKAGDTGKGRTVAITSFDGFELSNVPLLYKEFGLPTPTGGVLSNVTVKVVRTGYGGQNTTPTGEGDADIQCLLSVAPLCNLIVYDGGATSLKDTDPLGTLALESNDDLADIITESYLFKNTASFYATAHAYHLSMSAQGITYMNAAGDHGAPGVAGFPYPNIDPEVLSVGGTTATTDTTGDRTTETAWTYAKRADGTWWGGAGGWIPSTDAFNVLPSWQVGTGIPTNVPYRLIPDVALTADASYEIYFDGVFRPSKGVHTGGTSCASPTFAGFLADTEEHLIASAALPADTAGKQRFGRLQDLLYSYNGDSTIFYDVTSGNIGDLPNGSLASAGKGWDFATGWGAMNFGGFYNRVSAMARLKTLTVAPSPIEGGKAATGTITLTKAAPTGGLVVTLGSSSTLVTAPASVKIAAGATTATFALSSSSVSASQNVTIKATEFDVPISVSVTVTPPKTLKVSLPATSAIGGASLTGTVTIDQAAPTGGVTVTLSSSNSAVAKPTVASVVVAAGSTSATFTVSTTPTASNVSLDISAASGGATVSTGLIVDAPTVASVSFGTSSLYPGAAATGTVKLTGAAPTGGVKVALSLSSTSAAKLSAPSLLITAGATSGTFTLTAQPVDANVTETVSAVLGVTKATAVTIKPSILTGFSVSPTSVQGNGKNKVTGTLALNGAAGPSGVTVTLSTATTAANLPKSVAIPAGAKSVTFTFIPSSVSINVTATLTAKLASVSINATLTITH